MTGAELYAEMCHAEAGIQSMHLRRIAALGCSMGGLATLGALQQTIGVQSVRWLSGGLYEPDQDGSAALIVAVVDAERELADPGVVDLLAIRTSDPRRWAWRTGTAWALGEHLLDRPSEPLRVVETPLDWIGAGGDALCVLDWSAPSPCWARLRSGPPLVLASDALRRRLANAITRSVPLPQMEVACAA